MYSAEATDFYAANVTGNALTKIYGGTIEMYSAAVTQMGVVANSNSQC